MDKWQERWDAGGSGRWVYCFFPDVRVRMRSDFVLLDHFTSQLVTGHGQLKAKLFELGLAADPWCPCGEGGQSAEHILWECKYLNDERHEMLDGLSEDTPRPPWCRELMQNANNFQKYRQFVDAWKSKWERLRG